MGAKGQRELREGERLGQADVVGMMFIHQTKSLPEDGLAMVLVVLPKLFDRTINGLTRSILGFQGRPLSMGLRSFSFFVPGYGVMEKGALLTVKFAEDALRLALFFDTSSLSTSTCICKKSLLTC